ncbi:MAG: amino acid permease [Bacteroidia bacterium]
MAFNGKQLFERKSLQKILAQRDGEDLHGGSLSKVLTVRDLTALGIAAIVGAGIFSTVGKACFDGGPGVIFLFIITPIVCAFSALCYAEFASRVPISGSAYTYSYVAFGELTAWIIGWALIMEYAIGNIVVAISWSSNLKTLLHNMKVDIPDYLSTSFFEVKSGNDQFLKLTEQHTSVTPDLTAYHELWLNAPHIGGIPIILNFPALLITILITWLAYVGIKESRTGSNLMVAFKLLVVIAVIAIGFFYIQPSNWVPFLPNGMTGVMKGVSAVFFAYIGFDAISTTAEECKNPQRDLPKGMMYSLIACTVLYILLALVLTGMVKYTNLNTEAFLASAFNSRGMYWLGGIIALSAVVATTSVMLVFQLGQPRIWMSMSRDGLLPGAFKRVHPKFKTPSFATVITGLLVGIPALVLDSNFVTDLTSIGTLFAFVLVCGGILMLSRDKSGPAPKFKVPYINGRFVLPLIFIATIAIFQYYSPGTLSDFFNLHVISKTENISLTDAFIERIPYYIFLVICSLMLIFSILRKLSLIPVLGLLSCFYLMTQLAVVNWAWFAIWLIVGLVIYFTYGIKHSNLRKPNA